MNDGVKFRAVLFDLDDTLVWDERMSRQALMETAARRAAVHDLDAGRLMSAAKQAGDTLWRAHAPVERCDELGIVAFEGMWGHFQGEEDYLRHLREWTPQFRRAIWEHALQEQGMEDGKLAEQLGEFFRLRRRELQDRLPGAEAVLHTLQQAGLRIGLLTNGAASVQREKSKRPASGCISTPRWFRVNSAPGNRSRQFFSTCSGALGWKRGNRSWWETRCPAM